MCQSATSRAVRRSLVICILTCAVALGQTQSESPHPDWRKVGSSSVELRLAAPATGPVDNVWFSPDGRTLYARTHSGNTFETVDFENWTATVAPPARAESSALAQRVPAPNAILRTSASDSRRIYALADHVYESEDGGRNWTNLTAYKGQSVIGAGQHDLAASPVDSNQLVVANQNGVWQSRDGGMTWTGLNRFLPNLAVRRILATPANGRGVEVEIDTVGAAALPPGNSAAAYAWQPAEDLAYRPECRDTASLLGPARRRHYGGGVGRRRGVCRVPGWPDLGFCGSRPRMGSFAGQRKRRRPRHFYRSTGASGCAGGVERLRRTGTSHHEHRRVLGRLERQSSGCRGTRSCGRPFSGRSLCGDGPRRLFGA